MYTLLNDAPVERLLQLVKTDDPKLAERLRRMGLSAESRFMRLEEAVMLRPVRVRGPRGDAVIGAGMAGKIVVHLDDGRKLPLTEMKRRESGHIEGITCGSALQKALTIMGLGIDDHVTFLRALPPMEYITRIQEDARRISISEGTASKIWGKSGEDRFQFCMAPTGKPFLVEEILGGKRARRTMLSYGIEPGKTLIPEAVRPIQDIYMGRTDAIVISTTEGLRLILEACQARRIWVREVR